MSQLTKDEVNDKRRALYKENADNQTAAYLADRKRRNETKRNMKKDNPEKHAE